MFFSNPLSVFHTAKFMQRQSYILCKPVSQKKKKKKKKYRLKVPVNRRNDYETQV